jgi:uncharacterized protein YbjT (DUF2867 family)
VPPVTAIAGTSTRRPGTTIRLFTPATAAWLPVASTTFMQNLLGSAKTIAAEGILYAPMGDARVSLVDVRDIAAVAARVLLEPGHAGRTYVITGPRL